MRRPNEQCPSKPQEVVKQLEGLRDTLDAGLRQLAGDLVSVQQAHALIDRFLQIRVEIREEDVDAAQKTITKATAAVQDVQAAMTAIGRGGAR
jgi:ABC-type phosphate transport system auxiliary subunit